MTLDEAERLAQVEGLALVESPREATGYEGVRFKSGRRKPYVAIMGYGG